MDVVYTLIEYLSNFKNYLVAYYFPSVGIFIRALTPRYIESQLSL